MTIQTAIPPEILDAKILIVDNQAANVLLLQRMLGNEGYAGISVSMDPLEVCGLHRKHRYDLILLDLRMPGMDGFEVMQALQEIDPVDGVPVLVVTAQPDLKDRALRAGAKGVIDKPFDRTEILTSVRNLLETRLLPS